MSAASVTQAGGAQALPLHVALSVIPSLPRPMLARFVTRAIEQLDAMDGDPDLEEDDPLEEDDHGGGNVEDEGEAESHEGAFGGGTTWGGRPDIAALIPYRNQPHSDLPRIRQQLRCEQ